MDRMVSEIEARIFLTQKFPSLTLTPFEVTSECDDFYNCIAWAANDNKNWWWPDPFGDWPAGCPRAETLIAFRKAFETLGYAPSNYSDEWDQFEYIAIYLRGSKPSHAARQLDNGRWTSKVGPVWDISHELVGLNGAEYGNPNLFMKRPRS